MSYAEKTKVPVSQSQNEIRRVLDKYEASGFAFGEQGELHVAMFRIQERMIKFMVPVPVGGKTRDKKGRLLTQDQAAKETRRRWRCLALAIKAKLECVESGLATLEEEFLSHIVLPNGKTMGQSVIPQLAQSYKDGKMPPLLGYGQ